MLMTFKYNCNKLSQIKFNLVCCHAMVFNGALSIALDCSESYLILLCDNVPCCAVFDKYGVSIDASQSVSQMTNMCRASAHVAFMHKCRDR